MQRPKIDLNYWKIGKEYLSSLAYDVLYKNQTEAPRDNLYWNFSEQGLYVDPIDGTILFSSYDKYFSQCGWPAFLKPFKKDELVYVRDSSHYMERVEVRSKLTNLHLGHVFDDISQELIQKGYHRYCINSSALKFLSAQQILDSNEIYYQEAWKSEVAKHQSTLKELYLAGGCFWGIDLLFKQLPGVLATSVGYANSLVKNPSYKLVCTDTTGAVEAVKITFNLEYLSYQKILDVFFANINPTQVNGQANDIGSQYRSGLYYVDQQSEKEIKAIVDKVYRVKYPNLATELLPLENYYQAETNHQDYLIKNPNGYCHIQFKNL